MVGQFVGWLTRFGQIRTIEMSALGRKQTFSGAPAGQNVVLKT
jgi:hypothetical protein